MTFNFRNIKSRHLRYLCASSASWSNVDVIALSPP
jgi:hypothetical protein